jgi:hypothetical protein
MQIIDKDMNDTYFIAEGIGNHEEAFTAVGNTLEKAFIQIVQMSDGDVTFENTTFYMATKVRVAKETYSYFDY